MKLTLEGIRDAAAWREAGIRLPGYDAAALAERTRRDPLWVHFGIGNIFRIFVGSIADRLVAEGRMDRGITCVESFDFDIVDRIYRPCDNLSLSVILHGDGTVDQKVIGVFGEAIAARRSDEDQWARL